MSNEPNPSEFRQKLFSAQDVSPQMRAAYQSEVDSMLNPTLTPRRAAPGIFLLVLLIPATAMIIRQAIVHRPSALLLCGWLVLAAAFTYSAVLIIKDLVRGKHSPKAAHSIAGALYMAAGVLTVVALFLGMRTPSDPKATFGAFYVFVFYFACAIWSIENRIAAAQLAAREQMLRLECRLADLAEKLGE
jgi:uncharacterized PurR-regulated membrane protein YhhQ (DUF165 family)